MSKDTIIKGTLILTIAGFVTRLIGFFYRIYLSNTLGAELLGVYQLVFPIYAICFTLYGSGIQTAISRLVAAEFGLGNKGNMKKVLRVGLFFSLCIALFLSVFLYTNSDYIALNFLKEERCASSLRILAVVFPFCGITACINGYYYGMKKASVPAMTQLFEQIVRVVSVYFIANFMGGGDIGVTCELAVLGIVLGEIASNLFNIGSLVRENKAVLSKLHNKNYSRQEQLQMGKAMLNSNRTIAKSLFKLIVPLASNRLLISILQSFEAVLIPSMLKKSGLSTSEALSVYGILSGMSLPFIMFPSAITNSLAVMLLPTVSEAQATSNDKLIDITAAVSMKYSLIIGILSTGVFIVFGRSLGNIVFHNEMAGNFLITLSWLCPFLYLTTTLGSIINGLGKAHLTFFNSIVGLTIRILFVLYLVPNRGISGYLIGLLTSQLAISALDILAILRNIKITFNAVDWILKPGLSMLFTGFFTKHIYDYLSQTWNLNSLLLLLLSGIILCISYLVLLFATNAVSIKEFKR